MRERRSLANLSRLAALGGLGLFVALIARQGVGELASALAGAGPGLLVVAAFHLAPLTANAIGWRCLIPAPPPLLALIRARWISESINSLLPVAQIGGNVVRAGLVARAGVPPATAGASVVVDVTMNVFAQLLFTAIGLGMLVLYAGQRHLAAPVLLGMLIMAGLLFGFYLSQRRGLFGGATAMLGRVTGGRSAGSLAVGAATLDDEVQRRYADQSGLRRAVAWHLGSWILGVGEVWLALAFLGHPVGLGTALLIESLGQALRSAAFFVPGALGVQEGGYMLIGAAFGLEPGTALALSLAKRVRELLLGLPGLTVWMLDSARRALPARALPGDDVGVVEQ